MRATNDDWDGDQEGEEGSQWAEDRHHRRHGPENECRDPEQSGVHALTLPIYRAMDSQPRVYGAQSPGEPGPGAGPAKGGPDQMSSRPQDRSTRLASPCQPSAVLITSPCRTVIDTRIRPPGERASTCHGRGDRRLAGTPSSSWQPMQAPGASLATSTLLTRRVTLRVVPFWIERLIAPAGTVPGNS